MGYILFSSDNKLRITARPTWNGIIEYSYDNKEWKEWNGKQIINNRIYMRGINNTIVSDYRCWHIYGNNVRCQGNIENLLDYKSVINNVHPKMGKFCFANMFYNNFSIIEAPQLLSTPLSYSCYSKMFCNCINLQNVSPLIINELSDSYCAMFLGCTSLTSVSIVANFSIAKEIIINQHMFVYCNSLTTININNKDYDINVLKLL